MNGIIHDPSKESGAGGHEVHEDELEGPYELPAGWVWTTLGDACEVNPRDGAGRELADETLVSFVPMAAVDAASGTIASPEERPIATARKGFTRFGNGDVIMAKITPSMENGKAAIARGLKNGLGFGSTEFHVLRPSPATLPEYAFYFIRQESFRNEAKANFAGTAGQLRVPSRFLGAHLFPLAPLPEQRRIVAKIEELFSSLDAGVASLRRVQAALKRYRAAVLKAACEGRLVPQDPNDEPAEKLLERILAERRAKWEADLREKGKDPKKAKYDELKVPETQGLPELPQGWCWATFDMVGDVQGGIQKQPKRTPKEHAYPYLRVANVLRGRLDLSDVQRLELFGDELEKLRLQLDDLLIVEGNGSRDEIGRSALWKGQISDCVHQNHIIRVRFTGIAPAYTNHFLNSPTGIAGMMDVASSTSGLYTLSVSKVKAIVFPIPPLPEQLRIVAEIERLLSVVGQLALAVEDNLVRAERLRQAILRRAFEGKLVEQNNSGDLVTRLLQ